MPKKPLTAFSLFVRKKSKKFPELKGVERMKVFAKDWNELPEEKKVLYLLLFFFFPFIEIENFFFSVILVVLATNPNSS